MTQNNFEPGDAAPRRIDHDLQAAVQDMNLDARYSPKAIAARLKLIEDEAEALKKLRRDS